MFEPDFDPRERGRFERGRGPEGFGVEGDPRRRRRRPHGPGRGGPHGHGRGRRARRGDIRQAILLLLEDGPRNGYGLMQEVEDRSGGAWRPSPGSVYPALAQLEDEGLVEMNETDGRKEFSLTDAGKAWIEENRERVGSPWDVEGRGAPNALGSLMKSTKGLMVATRQVAQSGTQAQVEEAQKIVDETRRKLYGILAAETDEDEA